MAGLFLLGDRIGVKGGMELIGEDDLDLALQQELEDDDLVPPLLNEVEYLLPEPGPWWPEEDEPLIVHIQGM